MDCEAPLCGGVGNAVGNTSRFRCLDTMGGEEVVVVKGELLVCRRCGREFPDARPEGQLPGLEDPPQEMCDGCQFEWAMDELAAGRGEIVDIRPIVRHHDPRRKPRKERSRA
jgi:hypothetical protein